MRRRKGSAKKAKGVVHREVCVTFGGWGRLSAAAQHTNAAQLCSDCPCLAFLVVNTFLSFSTSECPGAFPLLSPGAQADGYGDQDSTSSWLFRDGISYCSIMGARITYRKVLSCHYFN